MDFRSLLQSMNTISEGDVVHKGTYGTSHGSEDVRDQYGHKIGKVNKDAAAKKPEVKRGRGRPKKGADSSGEVKKYDWSAFGGSGKDVKLGKWDKSKTTKHSLKEYIEEVETTQQLDEAEQLTIAPAQQNTQVIKQGNKMLGTVTNPQLAAQIKQAIGQGQMTLNPGTQDPAGMKQGQMAEEGGEKWIQKAIKHPGALTKKAKAAGMSTSAFAKKHAHDSGTTGKQARLAQTLAKMHEGEQEIDESGLQAYLGNKKYGKEGMDALRKAGREGAGKEKMASIRAHYDKMDEEAMDEKAPPGAKAERMVKHIKASYAKDGKLTPKEKAIAYAKTWDAHNKGQVEESIKLEDGTILTEGAMKDLVTCLLDDLENGPKGYNIQSAVELGDKALAQRIIDKTLQHGDRYKRLAGTLKGQLRDYALEEFGFTNYDQSLDEADTNPEVPSKVALRTHGMDSKPSAFKAVHDTPTGKAEPTPWKVDPIQATTDRAINFISGLGKKSVKESTEDMKDVQLESWEQQLNSLLTEGITVSSSTGQQGSPDSLSITATDNDAQSLMGVLRNAGIGGFGAGEEKPEIGYGVAQGGEEEPDGTGTEPQPSPDVVGDGDDMLALIKKMSGIETGSEGGQDYEDEEGEEQQNGALEPADSDDGEEEHDSEDSGEESDEEEQTDEGNAFSGAVAKAKKDGIQPGEKINVGGKEYPVKEDDMEEGNMFTGNLAKARAQGKEEADLDNDGDMEKVHEGHDECNECGYTMEDCECDHEQMNEFANDAGGDAMAETELAKLKALLSMGGDLHRQKRDQTVLNPTQVTVRESINEWKKLSGIK